MAGLFYNWEKREICLLLDLVSGSREGFDLLKAKITKYVGMVWPSYVWKYFGSWVEISAGENLLNYQSFHIRDIMLTFFYLLGPAPFFVFNSFHYSFLILTLSGPRSFWYRKGRGGGLDSNPPSILLKVINTLYAHILPLFFFKQFSVLRVLGLKKASKFDLFQKFRKPKSSFLNIF